MKEYENYQNKANALVEAEKWFKLGSVTDYSQQLAGTLSKKQATYQYQLSCTVKPEFMYTDAPSGMNNYIHKMPKPLSDALTTVIEQDFDMLMCKAINQLKSDKNQALAACKDTLTEKLKEIEELGL